MSSWKWSTEDCIIWKHEKHENSMELIHYNVFMKTKYRTLYHMKSITEINTLQCLHEKVWNNVSMKSITEINTLQCLHENEVQKIVSHEKQNRN